jgi:hypothetical protein
MSAPANMARSTMSLRPKRSLSTPEMGPKMAMVTA